MATELPPLRRVVCSIDARGKSVVSDDGPPPAVRAINRPGYRSRNIWSTWQSPAKLDEPDRTREIPGLMPPVNGTVLKYIDFPPEGKEIVDDKVVPASGPPLKERGLRRFTDSPIHPGMHETDTIDYAIVLKGEIYAIMDKGETLMKQGDVLIQRATSHAWANRSDEPCRVLFILVDGPRKEGK